jgi:hypothetical protein
MGHKGERKESRGVIMDNGRKIEKWGGAETKTIRKRESRSGKIGKAISVTGRGGP